MPSLRLFAALVTIVSGLMAAGPGARANESFSVTGVEVDVVGANVSMAKEQAIAEGQARALRILLERMTAPADHVRLPNPDPAQYVRDMGIEQERSSAVRYIAQMTVRFNPTAVRKLLRGAGIPFAEARARPVVVVPVFRPAEGPALLWEEANPWRAAWSATSGGLVPLTVPPGDAADFAALSTEQALGANTERLATLGARYNSPDVLVLAAAMTPGGRQLDVLIFATPGAPKPFDQMAFAPKDGETEQVLMRRAAREISRAMDGIYKQPNLLKHDQAATMAAIVPLTGLDDWLAVRERLSRIGQVRRTELVSLSREEAALILHIVGSQEQAKAALANAGLSLEWSDGYWTMRRRR